MSHQTQQQKFVNWQGDAEFKGKDFTATVTVGNPDMVVGSGRVEVEYSNMLPDHVIVHVSCSISRNAENYLKNKIHWCIES